MSEPALLALLGSRLWSLQFPCKLLPSDLGVLVPSALVFGHMKMTGDKLLSKIHLIVSLLVSLLKKNWENACAVDI